MQNQDVPKSPTRDGFGRALLELGRTDKRVVALSADLTDSTRAGWFKKEFPERFFSCGVAEQDMIGIAAGLSLMGKIPFACTFGVFASGRAWDQVRISVAYMNLNVKIVGTHAGISVGEDGATHQALEEIALMRILPNMTIVVPADSVEAKKATFEAAKIDGPVYLRLGRNASPVFTGEKDEFKIGKANVLADGSDVAIIACGQMVWEALGSATLLEKDGIRARVVNLHTPKPIDEKTVIESARKTGCVVTAEEHMTSGGLGSAVAELLAENCPVPMRMVGVRDKFGVSGEPKELFRYFNLTSEDIAKAARDVLKIKGSRL
jgi:transketolase